MFDPRRIPGLLALFVVAIGIGWLGDLIRRLRDSERDYRGLLDQAADAIFIFADDGRFAQVNIQACALTGYSRDELLDRSISHIMPQAEAGEIAARIASLGDTPRKDGAIVPTEISATRLADGRVQVVICDASAREAAAALWERDERFRLVARHQRRDLGLGSHGRPGLVERRYAHPLRLWSG